MDVTNTTKKKLGLKRSEMKTFHILFSHALIIMSLLKNKYLKVVSATFLLVCFVCLKESTCETRKNAFYFTSKAVLVLEIIKF